LPALATPTVEASITSQGLPSLTWTSVPGAATYRIATLARVTEGDGGGLGERVIASGLATTSFVPDREGLADFTVVDLTVPGAIQDEVGNAWNQEADAWWRPHDLGVYAVAADGRVSEPGIVDGVNLAGLIPVAIAPNATSYLFASAGVDTKGRPFYGTVATLPTEIAMTMADGSTAARRRDSGLESVQYAKVKVTGPRGVVRVDCAVLKMRPLETELTHKVRLCGPRIRDGELTSGARKALARQDRRAARAAAEGDLGEYRVAYAKGAPTLDGAQEIARDLPEVEYPVQGSTAFTRFVAANLLAGHPCMTWRNGGDADVTPEEALAEAQYQNPYLLGATLWISDERGDEFCVGGVPLPEEAEPDRQELAELAAAIVRDLDLTTLDDEAKAQAIDTFLAESVAYDDGAYDPGRGVVENLMAAADRPRSYTALGALADHVAVCLGYAEAFQAIAIEAGLATVVVTGQAAGDYHAWNKAHVNGRWGNIDSTWNSPSTGGHPGTYFLLSDADLAARRTGGEDPHTWVPHSQLPTFAAP